MKLNIEVQKAKDGRDYVQIMSDDYTSVNIVLIADKIKVEDKRKGSVNKKNEKRDSF